VAALGGASRLASRDASAAPPAVLARTVEAGLGVARSGRFPADRAGTLAGSAAATHAPAIPIQKINEAYEQLLKGDVKYRFVIDMASLKS
jgi:hypothetical protein